MQSTKEPYEAPIIRCAGDVVQHTHANLVHKIELDCTPLSVMGSVGFGV